MSRSDEFAERLTEFGVPVDAVVGLVREELTSAVQAANAVSSSPQGQWLNQHQQQIGAYLQARPELAGQFSRLAQGDALGAVEFLRMKIESEGGGRSGGTVSGGGSYNSSFGSGAQLLPMGGGEPSVEEAAARYERTGSRRDAERYAKARLGGIIEGQFNRAGQSLGPDPF